MQQNKNTIKLKTGSGEIVVPIDRQNEFLQGRDRVSRRWLLDQGVSEAEVEKIISDQDNVGSLSWRVLKIQSEFVKGYDFLEKFGKSVSIFGSARRGFGDEVYKKAERIAKKLADDGFNIFTGGGPGIMEAANKGAKESTNGRSIGININLPGHGPTERKNPYLDEAEAFDFFFSRKVILSFSSQFYIFFPGGFGTMDELFEMLTLIQTGKTSPIPVVLVDKEFWSPLVDWIKKVMCDKNKAISEKDLDLFYLVDDAEEAYQYIKECELNNCG